MGTIPTSHYIMDAKSVHNILKNNFPLIQKLENLDELKELRMLTLSTGVRKKSTKVEYYAKVDPEIYDTLDDYLTEHSVLERKDFCDSKVCFSGKANECRRYKFDKMLSPNSPDNMYDYLDLTLSVCRK